MKNLFGFIGLLGMVVCAFAPLYGQDDAQMELPKELRRLSHPEFQSGEYLAYRVHFGKMSAGRGSLWLKEGEEYNGRSSYLLTMRLWTNDFFSSFYRVDDVMTSILDREGLFPWGYERILREGKFKAFRKARFDPLNARAFEGKDTLAVPAFSQDVLSIIYYVRTLDLEVGQKINLDSYIDKHVYPLQMTVEKREKIEVPAGKFDCLLLVPGKRPGSDKELKGEMWIWLSTDDRRLPVRIKSRAPLGSVRMELDEIKIQH